MKLTRDVILGVEILGRLKGRTSPVSVKEMAKELNESEKHLLQLCRKLRAAGLIVRKQKGPGGGMNRADENPVSVMTVFEAFNRKMAINPETKEGQILQKFEDVLKAETC